MSFIILLISNNMFTIYKPKYEQGTHFLRSVYTN